MKAIDNSVHTLYNTSMSITLEEMIKRSHQKQFGKMTPEEKSEHFRKLQQKRKKKKGRFSKTEAKLGA